MLNDSSQSAQRLKPWRGVWGMRLLLSITAACVAWWGVRELVAPQPIARLKLPEYWMLYEPLMVGSCCILELHHTQAYHRDKLVILDLKTGALHEDDTRFGVFDQNLRLIPHLTVIQNRYVIQFLHATSLLVHDMATGTRTVHDFPRECSITVRENCDSLVESSILPVAPLTALSPAPWSAIPAALLMSCDAQRLYQQPIGLTLVQVRHVPDMQVVARYALPVTVGLEHLQLTPDGKHVLRGFGASSSAYPIPSDTMNPRDRRVESLVIPVRLGAMRKLQWTDDGRMNMNLLAHWAYARVERISNGKPHPGDRHTIQVNWVDIDLSETWPNLNNQVEIYHAVTGKLIKQVSFKSAQPGIGQYCSKMVGNWVLVGVMRPASVHPQLFTKESRGPGVLHVPSGRIVPFSELPETFWDRNYLNTAWSPGHESGDAVVRSRYWGNRSADQPYQAVLFEGSGTVKTIVVTTNQSLDRMIPHSCQMLKVNSLFETMPEMIRLLIARWSWLKAKTSTKRMTILDLESRSMLWNVPALPLNQLERHPAQVSRDGRLLIVPEQKEADHLNYSLYTLPLSQWLPWWPWLSAVLVLAALLLSRVIQPRFHPGKLRPR